MAQLQSYGSIIIGKKEISFSIKGGGEEEEEGNSSNNFQTFLI